MLGFFVATLLYLINAQNSANNAQNENNFAYVRKKQYLCMLKNRQAKT